MKKIYKMLGLAIILSLLLLFLFSCKKSENVVPAKPNIEILKLEKEHQYGNPCSWFYITTQYKLNVDSTKWDTIIFTLNSWIDKNIAYSDTGYFNYYENDTILNYSRLKYISDWCHVSTQYRYDTLYYFMSINFCNTNVMSIYQKVSIKIHYRNNTNEIFESEKIIN